MAVSFCTLSLLDLSTMSVFADGLHAKRRVLCPFLRFQSLVPSFTALYSFIHWKLYNEWKGGRAPGLLSPHIYPAPLFSQYTVACGFIPCAICQIDSETGTANKRVVQYDWSMVFKGPIKRCNTFIQVRYYQYN